MVKKTASPVVFISVLLKSPPFLLFSTILLSSCVSKDLNARPNTAELVNVCKSAIHKTVGTSMLPSQMEGFASQELVDVRYTRDDGKVFKYQCKYYPSSLTTGSVVWRGVDIFRDGDGPGVWRERPYDPIVNYWIEKDSSSTEREIVTIEVLQTEEERDPTGDRVVVKYDF